MQKEGDLRHSQRILREFGLDDERVMETGKGFERVK
jgi:hypothetical protein